MWKYETSDEANTRLNNSMFLYKGELVSCVGVFDEGRGLKARIVFYPRGVETADVSLDDPFLNYRDFSLGYANIPGGATYVMRVPCVGAYKQGLTQQNLVFSEYSKQERPQYGRIVKQPGFSSMLKGEYPTLEQCFERIKAEGGPESCAFHSKFAIWRDGFREDTLLYYKGRKAGFGDVKGFKLPSENMYLKEVCQKSGVPLR
jgi:hypothetical protein